MKVINNGKRLIIEVDFNEAAILTEALRKGATLYERENLTGAAEQTHQLLHGLLNKRIIKVGESDETF